MGEAELRGRTLSFSLVAGVLLIVHGRQAPEPGEWQAMIEAEKHLPYRGALVVLDSRFPGLSAAQRRAITDAWQAREQAPRCALITTNRMHRAIMTALNWFLRGAMRSFAPNDVLSAIGYVGAREPSAAEAIVARARELGTGLGSHGLLPASSQERGSA